MSRYKVGEVVPVIGFKIQYGNGNCNIGFSTPRNNDTVIETKIQLLTCTEEHKVPWSYDPEGEKKYDGFVFQTQDNQVFENQYPTAEYGQLSNTCDRIFESKTKPEDKSFWSFYDLKKYLGELESFISTKPKDVNWYIALRDSVCLQYNVLTGKTVLFHPIVFHGVTLENSFTAEFWNKD